MGISDQTAASADLKKNIFLGALSFLLIGLSACLPSANTSKSSSSTVLSGSSSIPSGARAVKIIFKPVSQGGSFEAPLAAGSVNAAGSGTQVVQLYNADGSTLATSKSSTSWPKWLTSFEIGISGSANSNAKNPYCARFATTGSSTSDDSQAKCEFKTGVQSSCGAPGGYYRVSDFDCFNNSDSSARGIGAGSDTDGVYLRGVFNRSTDYLGQYENILAVLEYSASGINPAPKDPSTCFSAGAASVESCSDMTWKVYLKHTLSESLQSFLLLVPPTFASVNTANGTGGSGISTKQFVLPLASDSNLQILQISRTGLSSTLSADPNFAAICSPNGTSDPANSALCVGMVFYSLTLYRI